MTLRHAIYQSLAVMYSVSLLAAPATLGVMPADNSNQVLSRESNVLEVKTSLSKNIFRTESYEDSYTEKVPYHEQETYWEDVPYSESVPYTDYEVYYDQEYRCHDETEYRRDCRRERDCRTRPGREVCEIQRSCVGAVEGDLSFFAATGAIKPRHRDGRDAHQEVMPKQEREHRREPGRPVPPRPPNPPRPPPRPPRPPDCHERRVCHPGPVERDCRDVERCDNIPVRRERCEYENVRRTRPVTKYRDEVRYRRVQRQRTVTRYRDEIRCCVTKTRQVFDHQWVQPVTVVFPVDAILNLGEREVFQLSLGGSETQPLVALKIVDSIFGYKVIREDIKPGLALIELGLQPKYTGADLGAQTIKGLALKIQGAGVANVSFEDSGRKTRVQSSYRVSILDQTGQIISTADQAQVVGNRVQIALPGNLPSAQRLQILLDVSRQGLVIAEGQTAFQVQASYSGILEIGVQKDNSKIQIVDIEGNGPSATLVFQDNAPAHPDVNTLYKISTSRKSAGRTVYMQDKSFDRGTLSAAVDGSYRIRFADLGISAQNLQDHFNTGDVVTVSLEVFRTTPTISGRIALWQGKTLTLR